MNYIKQVAELANYIQETASVITSLETERDNWLKPAFKTFSVGGTQYHVIRKDGTVTPGLEGVQSEAIKLHDHMIFKNKSKLEGLRFKLAQLGKTGGSA